MLKRLGPGHRIAAMPVSDCCSGLNAKSVGLLAFVSGVRLAIDNRTVDACENDPGRQRPASHMPTLSGRSEPTEPRDSA